MSANSGPNDAAIMLRIRAEVLKASLERVKNFLENAPSRRKDIEKLEGELKALMIVATNIDSSVYSAKSMIVDEIGWDLPATPSELQKRVEELQGICRTLKTQLESILKVTKDATDRVTSTVGAVREMKAKCFQIQRDEPVGLRLNDDLAARTKEPAKVLAQVQQTLTKSLPDAGAWAKYGNANRTSQDIFAEYVDFLGGMALRDIGFDEGISRMAEDLIRTYTSNHPPIYPSALPAARREAVAKTLARIVRVGFPEWTIWALPFTAHAFWHVIARYDSDEALRDEIGEIPERFQVCLADAFATYTMGPAYAYCAFYLLLSPLEADVQDETSGRVGDDTRARAILEMLRAMSANDSAADIGYDEVAANLNNMWTAALQQAGVAGRTPQTAGDNEAIVKIVDALEKTLRECECTTFPRTQWDQVETPQQLQSELPLQIGQLRRVLNGMWKARVDPAAKNIDGLANKVVERIMKRGNGQGPAASPNAPSKVTAQ